MEPKIKLKPAAILDRRLPMASGGEPSDRRPKQRTKNNGAYDESPPSRPKMEVRDDKEYRTRNDPRIEPK